MKMKTNKLLTLTLATGLVAMTAGCGASKTPAATGGGDNTPNTTTPPADTVAYSDWSGDATLVTDTTENGFVAGNAASIALTPALTGVESLNLRSEVTPVNGTVSAITLGGDAVDGVAFASNGATTATELRYFAALHSGTDLGAPVPTTGAEAIWSNGLFQAVGAAGTYATDSKTFALTVTFGTTDATRTIRALVGANTNADAFTATGTSYYISGNYDAAGVITGNVLYRDFSAAANDADARTAAAGLLTTATGDTPTDPETVGLGVLSGLIGAQGAVGGFYSSGSDGNGETGFAGGFVVSALPNLGGEDSDAVYADWAAGATQAADTTDNAFLAGTATALTGSPNGAVVTAIDLADVVTAAVNGQNGTDGTSLTSPATPGTAGVDGSQLGGDATNGVAFGMNGATTEARFFAGLLNTTDLGAPISATPVAGIWNGLFEAVGANAVRKAFVLTVTFSATEANTITGLVPVGADTFADDAMSYYISGTYNADGLITGNILYGDFSDTATDDDGARGVAVTALEAATATTNGLGVLSGLIGTDGAVGAFYSNAEGATAGYAGGFVASTDTVIVLDATDGTDGAAYVPPVAEYADLTITAPTDLTTANGFLLSTTPDVLTFTQPTNTVTPTVLSLPTGTAGGVSFFTTGASGSERYFAGIHFDTSLGAPFPLTNATTATWDGMFAAVGDTNHATTAKSVTDLLTVTFGASPTIQGSVPAGAATSITVGTTAAYHINAVYDAAGVISGTVLYEAAATSNGLATAGTYASTAGFGRVIGLIGASGAVGAFHSDNAIDGLGAAGYAGGFYATP